MARPPPTRPDRIGRFEIRSHLGSGGAGEVYRAFDPRLRREVAIKLVRSEVAGDPGRRARLEEEARAVAGLNHPNVLGIHEVGVHECAHYLVAELLDGMSLRRRLRAGPLSLAQALDYSAQVAGGLSAAHEHALVHCDIKPDNLFVTRHGVVKIIDFGLARSHLSGSEGGADGVDRAAADPNADTASRSPASGTAAYMSPEQVRGAGVDGRSDIFSLGVVLFEMLSGQVPFRGATRVETMSAILRAEPPDLAAVVAGVPRAVACVVTRCLEKKPWDRFHSAHDLRLALGAVAAAGIQEGEGAFSRGRPSRPRAKSGLALLLGALLGLAIASRIPRQSRPAFRQLTFQRGTVNSARFSTDGHTILFGAAWKGESSRVFVMRPDVPVARVIGARDGKVAGSVGGEVAILHGTLSRVAVEGGGSREVGAGVVAADWSRDGQGFALVRADALGSHLEYPQGRAVHRTATDLRLPRISPDGTRVVVVEKAQKNIPLAFLTLIEAGGRARPLTGLWREFTGLAWSPDGLEVWFTGDHPDTGEGNLHAVDLEGRHRALLAYPGSLVLHDVSPDGRALVSTNVIRHEARGRAPGDSSDRDLSWLDRTWLNDLSKDGRTLLFYENARGARLLEGFQGYIRRLDGSSPLSLGRGVPHSLSPDGRSVLWTSFEGAGEDLDNLCVRRIEGGTTVVLSKGSVSRYYGAWWLPDGQHAVIAANETGRPRRLFVQDTAGSQAPRPLTPEGVVSEWNPARPDGRYIVAPKPAPDLGFALYPVAGGEPQPLPGLRDRDVPLSWSRDGRFLFVQDETFQPRAKVARVDVRSGLRRGWLTLFPVDPSGIEYCNAIVASDGDAYVYYCRRRLSDLFLVEGLS